MDSTICMMAKFFGIAWIMRLSSIISWRQNGHCRDRTVSLFNSSVDFMSLWAQLKQTQCPQPGRISLE